jgi:hypothetical protein
MRPPRVSPVVKGILGQPQPVFMSPCVVTNLTPLTISMNGATGILAVKVLGATYSLGPANAITTNPGIPIVLPIG